MGIIDCVVVQVRDGDGFFKGGVGGNGKKRIDQRYFGER